MSMMDYNHEQARRNWYKLPDMELGQQSEPPLRCKSGYEREIEELGDNIVFLEAVIDTLTTRLRQVIQDVPTVATDPVEPRMSSPIVSALNEANARVHSSAMQLQTLIERLDI